jgi:exodeoxyribonuclease VII large subunit
MPLTDKSLVLTVSQITKKIKGLLEGEFADVWVTGEVSNLTRASSGHVYFTIKDDKAELSCAMWRSAAAGVKISLKDGMKVVALGDISLYEPRGRYQLIVRWVIEEGVGNLELRFRELKERLAKEGLFDEDRKRPVPEYPQSVGIVTSPTGAAVRDMISIIGRRMPSCRIVVCPVAVQGKGSETEIAGGIKALNEFGDVDLIIVGRGGGSVEDLWAFNEEIVARAIFSSHIPVVSAVGHEIDYTISDFVADLRAPTPSAAAELTVPDRDEVAERVSELRRRLGMLVKRECDLLRARLRTAITSYAMRRPEVLLGASRQRLDDLTSRLSAASGLKLERLRAVVRLLDEKLAALSPRAVLQRGYAVCRAYPSLAVVRSSSDISPGDSVKVELARGSILGRVEDTTEP